MRLPGVLTAPECSLRDYHKGRKGHQGNNPVEPFVSIVAFVVNAVLQPSQFVTGSFVTGLFVSASFVAGSLETVSLSSFSASCR